MVFGEIGQMPIIITPATCWASSKPDQTAGAPTVAARARRTTSCSHSWREVRRNACAACRQRPVWPVRKALPANRGAAQTTPSPPADRRLLNGFDNHRCTFQISYVRLMAVDQRDQRSRAEAEWTGIDPGLRPMARPAERA